MERATWRRIAEELAARIESGELAAGTRIEPEESLAARLNVSRHTAHRALHELQRQGLLLRRPRIGTVVAERAPGGKCRIAYLVDFAGSRYQSEMMMHIEHALDEGARLVVSTSKNDPEREAESLRKLTQEVDGIICYPADGDANAEAFNRLAESGFPLVLVDRAPRGCEHLVVLTDNAQASEHAVRKLIEQGHRRIAFFGSNNDQAQSIRDRYLGYRAAVGGLGYPTRPYERWIPLAPDDHPEMMFQAVIDALTTMRVSDEPPTAAFSVQDRITMGLLEACNSLSLTVGVDFDIATFNDYGPMFLRQHRSMDRILQQVDQISVVAVQRLYALMRGQAVEPGPVQIPALYAAAENTHAGVSSSMSNV
ncbi:MAG: substrate-binding domain-containing protein [Fimbriimonas sp.]